MRAFVWSIVAVVGIAFPAAAQERFVERTPLPRTPMVHTMERAGYPTEVSRCAIPSVTSHDAGGYVGGKKLLGNHIFAKGSTAATGPLLDGTYGTDYAGIKVRPNRVFLAPSPDPSVGPAIANSYRSYGPCYPDPFAQRPVRQAVTECKEAKVHE